MKKKILFILSMMLLWGCQNDKTSIQKITLSQPVTMLYFYIETCSECQSFKETAIPYLEETFGDSLTIQQYDLDDDTTQAVYEDVIKQLYQFDQSLYGMGPMYAIEGYFAKWDILQAMKHILLKIFKRLLQERL